MSLINNQGANETVTVVLRAIVTNEHREREAVEVGRVLWSGRISPSTMEDVERYAGSGAAVLDLIRFTCQDFPGDDLSQVITSDGRVWDVVAAPQRYRSSPRVTRDIVRLSAQTQTRKWLG